MILKILTPHFSLFTFHFSLPPHFLIPILLLLSACSNGENQPLQLSGPTMGTTWHVSVVPPYPSSVSGLETAISGLLDEINAKMSTYIPDSELSLLNQTSVTDWISVSPELFKVIATASDISNRTDGAFDITIGAIVNLWGFGPVQVEPAPPDSTDITRAMQATGFQQLEFRATPPAVKKNPASYLDLSAIAKGYAVDSIAEYLEAEGIRNYLVEIGGEIRARGHNQRMQSWRVGIERPLVETRTVRDIIALENTAMATSGGYRNFITYEGKRYSHTIDPRSGWPVSHNLTSVSVLDKSSMVADALATALLVMGPETGYSFAERESIPALFIINDNGVFSDKYTTTFLPYLVK